MLIGWTALLFATQQCVVPPRTGAGLELSVKLKISLELRLPSGEPVPNARVLFLDTAPAPPDRGCGELVGHTDAAGKLEAVFPFSWADYFATDRRPDAGTFDILVADRVIHGSVECLPREGEKLHVAVGVLKARPGAGPDLPEKCRPQSDAVIIL